MEELEKEVYSRLLDWTRMQGKFSLEGEKHLSKTVLLMNELLGESRINDDLRRRYFHLWPCDMLGMIEGKCRFDYLEINSIVNLPALWELLLEHINLDAIYKSALVASGKRNKEMDEIRNLIPMKIGKFLSNKVFKYDQDTKKNKVVFQATPENLQKLAKLSEMCRDTVYYSVHNREYKKLYENFTPDMLWEELDKKRDFSLMPRNWACGYIILLPLLYKKLSEEECSLAKKTTK